MAIFSKISDIRREVLGGKARVPQLDGLRGIAILMVLMVHVWGYAGAPALVLFGGKWDVTFVPHLSMLGVDLFFVLSGYLLFSQSLERRDREWQWKNCGKFFSRRARRIVPGYYLLVFALFLVIPTSVPLLRLHSKEAFANLFHHLVFVHNFTGDYLYTFAYMWSLAVEMQFYLVFPFLAYFILRWRPGIVLPLLWFGAVLLAFLMLYFENRIPFQVDVSVFYRLNQFLIGCWVAFLAHRQRDHREALANNFWVARFCPWVGFALLIFLMWMGRERLAGNIHPGFHFWGMAGCYFWSALVGLAFGMIVLQAVTSSSGIWVRLWSNRFLGFLGVISYGIFLWHNPIIENLSKTDFAQGIHDPWMRVATLYLILLGIVMPIAVLSYYFVEAPFLRKKIPEGKRETTNEIKLPAVT